jgi:DNA-binding SARP family transcriptional activator
MSAAPEAGSNRVCRCGTRGVKWERPSRGCPEGVPRISCGRNVLRINALGSFAVIGDDGPLGGAVTQPRRSAVLALIARSGDRGIGREKILNYLWPDADEERGRRVLTRALSALRADLGAEDAILGMSDLRLNPAVVTCDVVEFDAAIAETDLDRAATLYKGPFLDGFRLPGADEFERWVEGERAALAHEYEVSIE